MSDTTNAKNFFYASIEKATDPMLVFDDTTFGNPDWAACDKIYPNFAETLKKVATSCDEHTLPVFMKGLEQALRDVHGGRLVSETVEALPLIERYCVLKGVAQKPKESLLPEEAVNTAVWMRDHRLFTALRDTFGNDALFKTMKRDNNLLSYAAGTGQQENTALLLSIYPTDQDRQEVLQAGNHNALCLSAKRGHIVVADKLLTAYPTDQDRQQALQANNHAAFRYSAEGGHTAVLEKLLAAYPTDQDRLQALRAENHIGLRYFTNSGTTAVVEKFLAIYPTDQDKLEALQANNHAAFRYSAEGGHTAVLEKLLAAYPTGQDRLEALQAEDNEGLHHSAYRGHTAVVEKLLAAYPTDQNRLEALQELRGYNIELSEPIQALLAQAEQEIMVRTFGAPPSAQR